MKTTATPTEQSTELLRQLLAEIRTHVRRIRPGWSAPEECEAVVRDIFRLTPRVQQALGWAVEKLERMSPEAAPSDPADVPVGEAVPVSTGWIRATERFPPVGQFVLCTGPRSYGERWVRIMRHSTAHSAWFDDRNFQTSALVEFWMPLPVPPNQEDETEPTC